MMIGEDVQKFSGRLVMRIIAISRLPMRNQPKTRSKIGNSSCDPSEEVCCDGTYVWVDERGTGAKFRTTREEKKSCSEVETCNSARLQ
ncbi:hypothetical protein AVEN_29518-1 [Araneus ventricosus]|uniref:Uncharacterized protein n=1 Tax=Araneus ventricosus TaxID=182803 RepID=A0A4Y2U418_ARAVE|nr:hypothetical protein AVEN_29518-1 [Araneus ventricosus]